MAYEPTNWRTGDVVTSAKLNKIEQGIASGGSDMFIVTLTGIYDESTGTSTYSADKTFAEIDAAFRARKAVYLRDVDPEDETYVQWFPPAKATSDGSAVSAYVWKQVSFDIPTSSSMAGSLYFTEYTLSAQGEWTNNYGEYSVSPRG